MSSADEAGFSAPEPPVVLDVSFALQAVLDGGPSLDRMAAWASDQRLRLVPPLFWAEIANVLLRRRGFEPGRAALTIASLARSGVETADRGTGAVADAVALADRHGLSVYDAIYLQVAVETEADLATFDAALQRAAIAEGLNVVPAH